MFGTHPLLLPLSLGWQIQGGAPEPFLPPSIQGLLACNYARYWTWLGTVVAACKSSFHHLLLTTERDGGRVGGGTKRRPACCCYCSLLNLALYTTMAPCALVSQGDGRWWKGWCNHITAPPLDLPLYIMVVKDTIYYQSIYMKLLLF